MFSCLNYEAKGSVNVSVDVIVDSVSDLKVFEMVSRLWLLNYNRNPPATTIIE